MAKEHLRSGESDALFVAHCRLSLFFAGSGDCVRSLSFLAGKWRFDWRSGGSIGGSEVGCDVRVVAPCITTVLSSSQGHHLQKFGCGATLRVARVLGTSRCARVLARAGAGPVLFLRKKQR
mmetsp:Transcript_34808/g.66848  ORF Transcript_34808/g.66848 Transcript_34808/m.66848 type:complete len:121 (+) Transcript_34808:70-432(+)